MSDDDSSQSGLHTKSGELPKDELDISKIKHRPIVTRCTHIYDEYFLEILSNKSTLSTILNRTIPEDIGEPGETTVLLEYRELCNFKTTKSNLPILEKHVYKALKINAAGRLFKTGHVIETDEIIAWTMDNFRGNVQQARKLLLKATCWCSPVAVKTEADVEKLAQPLFARQLIELPILQKNSQAQYNLIRVHIETLYWHVPILHLIKRFTTYHAHIIEKAVRYFGEDNIRSLSDAKFWDTFRTPDQLDGYIGENPSLYGDPHDRKAFISVREVQRSLLKHLLKALGPKLRHAHGMTDDPATTPEHTLNVALDELVKLEVRFKVDREEVRAQLFRQRCIHYPSSTDNSTFFEWARKVWKLRNDGSMQDVSEETFREINSSFKTNLEENIYLVGYMKHHPIVDYKSFLQFLNKFISWGALNDPKAIEFLRAAREKRQLQSEPQTIKSDASNARRAKRRRRFHPRKKQSGI